MSTRTGIALGSNLGNRLAYLREARDLLVGLMPKDALFLQAPVYQSSPVDCPTDSPDFYNTVVEINYPGTSRELLEITQAIERNFGRKPVRDKNAPRFLDLDLLYFGTEICREPDLIIPHPRLSERRFVLQPLADIRPDLILPGHLSSIGDLLRHLDSDEAPLTSVQDSW